MCPITPLFVLIYEARYYKIPLTFVFTVRSQSTRGYLTYEQGSQYLQNITALIP